MLNSLKSACLVGAVATTLFLGGCAVVQVQPGTPRAEVIARYGQPSREVPLADGVRLQYSYQPAGQQAVMVDLDAAGRVVSARQVLQTKEFARIVIGQWSRADIEREFGRSATIDRVFSWPGDIMTYRFRENINLEFYVYLDSANIVQRTGQGIDFTRQPRR
jgi:hypothetical protein